MLVEVCLSPFPANNSHANIRSWTENPIDISATLSLGDGDDYSPSEMPSSLSILSYYREKRSLDIDMRIGVHSGKILSGLIGIRKWQYDIWSKDVTIANKMESTGKAG